MQDLNVNPKLPFEDNTFDVITNVVLCPLYHSLVKRSNYIYVVVQSINTVN